MKHTYEMFKIGILKEVQKTLGMAKKTQEE